MDNKAIEVGDTVLVTYCYFEDVKGKVTHIPQDTGDMFIIVDTTGVVYHVNPCSSMLVHIKKVEPRNV
jgi:transcription antitermination factor NusG